MSQRIASVSPEAAEGRTAELLGAVKSAKGMVPNIIRVMASQPAVLEGYLGFSKALGTGSFDARTREAIALTVAGANDCGYCASAHSAVSRGLKVSDEEIGLRLSGRSTDARLDAILHLARTLVAKLGWADDSDLAAARAAGLGDAEIVEVVGNVSFNILTNYINHVAGTEIDFPVVDASAHRVAA